MIGITTVGKVGSEAARMLAQKDEGVRVLVREPDKAIALSQLRVDITKGDLDDVASVDAAMEKVTQNFLMLAPAIATTDRFGSSAGTGQVGFLDTRDVAAAAAQIAALPAAQASQTYLLTGTALLTYADVAATLSNVLGRPIVFDERTREEDKQTMIDAGVADAIAHMNAHAVSLIADGDAAWLSPDLPTIIGRPPRSSEQSDIDHAQAFTQGD